MIHAILTMFVRTRGLEVLLYTDHDTDQPIATIPMYEWKQIVKDIEESEKIYWESSKKKKKTKKK